MQNWTHLNSSQRTCRFQFLVAVVIILSTCSNLPADVIYLKDGTQLETDKAWEENGRIRFFLKGTDNIIITYSKDIVDRVEAGPPYGFEDQSKAFKPAPSQSDAKSGEVRQTENENALSNDISAVTSDSPPIMAREDSDTSKSSVAESSDTSPPTIDIKNSPFMFGAEYNGMPFYDPRREPRYRTGKDSHHSTLEDAIESLAKQFNQTPGWVKQHMGDTNDLGEIYRNLNRPDIESQPDSGDAQPGFVSGIMFYNPRRVYKYWISETGKYNTYDAAIAALAKQFGSTPEWIKMHMGDTNDLGEIHQNLMENKIRQSGQLPQ